METTKKFSCVGPKWKDAAAARIRISGLYTGTEPCDVPNGNAANKVKFNVSLGFFYWREKLSPIYMNQQKNYVK